MHVHVLKCPWSTSRQACFETPCLNASDCTCTLSSNVANGRSQRWQGPQRKPSPIHRAGQVHPCVLRMCRSQCRCQPFHPCPPTCCPAACETCPHSCSTCTGPRAACCTAPRLALTCSSSCSVPSIPWQAWPGLRGKGKVLHVLLLCGMSKENLRVPISNQRCTTSTIALVHSSAVAAIKKAVESCAQLTCQ